MKLPGLGWIGENLDQPFQKSFSSPSKICNAITLNTFFGRGGGRNIINTFCIFGISSVYTKI